ncbi:MAG: DNA polymerase III subunit delta [Parvularculaceae bacterium]|nr:DNA polymerase III subunit delta [Parvularculaceae bacterium]
MTALKGRAIEEFVRKRDASVKAALVYGPDQGLVRERADRIALQVVADLKDPFNAIEFFDGDLKGEPARIADEAQQLSFLGGERVIRVRTTGDAAFEAARVFVAGVESGAVIPNALVVIEAGDLGKTSKLRKLFEESKKAAALPCYVDGPAEVRALAATMSAAEDIRIEPEALEMIVSYLGEDRGVTRSELEKLVLYKGFKATRSGPATITIDDVRLLLSDGVGDAVDEAAAAAADGRADLAARALWRSAVAGASPISQLRALARLFSRLQSAQRLIGEGHTPDSAMKRLRPPVFFAEERAFRGRLSRWPLARLDAALDLILEAELSAKTTGAPQRELAERVCLQLAATSGG